MCGISGTSAGSPYRTHPFLDNPLHCLELVTQTQAKNWFGIEPEAKGNVISIDEAVIDCFQQKFL